MVINISFVSKGGRDLRCELVITMCDKLGRNILCSVFCPSEYLEISLHAFFMKRLWTALGTGKVKTKIHTQTLSRV
ncbi:unnamed protein product [Staurois parvus]|uniref:Uncharacterized protein n=1 Tax=Staurois parvus TaxID=386267 RepID=A0ABN9DMY9_9NEOB|nr:unnamed protein product [Staurois parvus]